MGLIGDIAFYIGPIAKELLRQPFIERLILALRNDTTDPESREISKWAFEQINEAIKRRKQRLEQSRDLMVEMRPEFTHALASCMNFSSKQM